MKKFSEEEKRRRARREKIIEGGTDPYPSRSPAITHRSRELLDSWEESTRIEGSVAGRVMLYRSFGKIVFFHIQDYAGRIQIFASKEENAGDWSLIKSLDAGDIVWIKGHLFKTKTGETTLRTAEFRLLSKSLSPLPEKFHGLKDDELRQRRRYLDLIANEETRHVFQERSRTIWSIRSFLHERGYLEVETPLLQPLPGGAAAEPFVTHHNTLEIDLYLRIAPELYLKRLLVGGFPKIFEIGRNFRNEGISTRHNPEFTMLELYEAYGDLDTIMQLTEELIRRLYDEIKKPLKPFVRKSYGELMKEKAGIDIFQATEGDLDKLLLEKKPPEEYGYWDKVEVIFDRFVEESLTEPVFVTRFPQAISPFAKRNPENENEVERFELYIRSMEIANAFTELNDPVDQRERLEARVNDQPHVRIDEDFLLALETGMPPAGGLGIGIDRLLMLLLGKESIREVILFPVQRPVQKLVQRPVQRPASPSSPE